MFLKNDFHKTTILQTHLAQPNIFPRLNVVGLLYSAHECVRPSLLDFLLSEPPFPAAIIIEDPTYHLVEKLRTEHALQLRSKRYNATAGTAKTLLNPNRD